MPFTLSVSVERRSIEMFLSLNDILSAELSIQYPISRQSKVFISGGEFGDLAFLCLKLKKYQLRLKGANA